MLVFGEVIATKGHKAKIKLPQYDNFETDWIFIPQSFTVKDKSSNIYEIGTLVSAVMSENFDDGCIIGALYNDVDVSINENKNIKSIIFSDGSLIEYNKETHQFNIYTKGQTFIKSDTKIVLNGDVEIRGNLKSSGNISDVKGSMQQIRNIYNEHSHGNGHNGSATTSPNNQM